MLTLYAISALQGIIMVTAIAMSNNKAEENDVCGTELALFVHQMDAQLDQGPENINEISSFLRSTPLPVCREGTFEAVFRKSRHYQSERSAINTETRYKAFRFGTESILLSIGYEPDNGNFPETSRYVKLKKTVDDSK